jgi:hypothetical protein
MAIGVFGLQVAYRLKRLEVMSVDDTHGWFGGGYNGGVAGSVVNRIDFSNDLATGSVRGSLSLARNGSAATGNSNYGWFGGGIIPTPAVISTVDRIDFSNDSATSSVRGPLSLARYTLGATGNSNYGWFGGGQPGPLSKVDRIDFSNDSGTASLRGNLILELDGLSATGNSNYGWFGGGFPSPVATIQRIDFTNDSATVSPRGRLSLERYSLGATGNSNYGWFGGGRAPITSIIERIDFSNDSTSVSVRGPLSRAKRSLSATGNSNYGWFGGGYVSFPGPEGLSTVERVDFSNDSVAASVRSLLSSTRYSNAATSGQAKGPAIKLQKTGSYGWFGGGNTTAVTPVSTLSRINFSNDSTTSSPRGSVFNTVIDWAATGNSNYGWFGGGTVPAVPTPTRTSTVLRVDFSNDSISATSRGPLSIAGRQNLAATGNSNYGWFAGGRDTPSNWITTIDRIDFSNDSTTLLRRGPLGISEGRQNLAATGNSNYGWFAGGTGPSLPIARSTIFRIDFSNDSSLAPSRSILNSPSVLGRDGTTATGNSNYGWFAGGRNPSPAYYSIVDRIDFSNDSTALSSRGLLTAAKALMGGMGNSNYGWFAGGFPGPSAISRVDRIDFSNDSVQASPRGLLDAARYSGAATSNSTR